MKRIVLTSLLCLPLAADAQSAKWRLSAQFVPELTFYQQRYPAANSSNKSSLNYGGAVGLQYHFNGKIFAGVGLSYIARTYHTNAYLEQGLLPAPKRSGSMELVTTHKITYRVISVPVSFGIKVVRTKKLTGFAMATLAANYLLNASYESNVSKYDGTYAKNEIQGASLAVGAGIDYRLTSRIAATSTLSYAFLNAVREDGFLSGAQSLQALNYTAMNLAVGFKYSL